MSVCHEEVTRKGLLEPCEKPAVAMRIDPNEGIPYPVCIKHTRAEMVPLERGRLADEVRRKPKPFSEGSNIVDTQLPDDFVPPQPASLMGTPVPVDDRPDAEIAWQEWIGRKGNSTAYLDGWMKAAFRAGWAARGGEG